MTLVDFIDVIDDIIDLSSDEETVQQDHKATKTQATLLDKQAVFVLVGKERHDEQAAFVSAWEGSQKATASPLVLEKLPLDTSESKNCPSSPTSAPFPRLTSTTPKAVTSEVGDTQLVATAPPSVMENAPLDTADSTNCPSSPASVPIPSLASVSPKAVTSEVGDAQLVATTPPSVMEKAPLDTADSTNCPSSPASAPLPSHASTAPKAVTSEDGDRKLARPKHPKKNYRTSIPRRSPRFQQKRECGDSPVEEPDADHKRPRVLEPAEISAASTDSTKTLSTDSATKEVD